MPQNASLDHIEGPARATEVTPERSARFSELGYSQRWNDIGVEGDVCGSQPKRGTTPRTGWDHEAMRD